MAGAEASFARLQRELPRASPRAWGYGALARLNRAGAQLSEGLRIGHTSGFDSGPFMAHVYADRAQGRTPLGRLLDRRLLDQPTCRAFREIRAQAQAAVLDAVDACGDQAVVADLAAGPSPYLLEALKARPAVRATLCDIDTEALAQARAAAAAAGTADRVQTRVASAFDRAALAELTPRPDVVLELGLYGIYHDDALIERHLKDVGEVLAPRQIVCNVQVANPDIERIARVWRNQAGERCVWRLRPAEQILDYAAAAGYRPVAITADTGRIYRVMRLAREAA